MHDMCESVFLVLHAFLHLISISAYLFMYYVHSGYSLLHYCCMYNLALLIPVLLSRGGSLHRYAQSVRLMILRVNSPMTDLYLAIDVRAKEQQHCILRLLTDICPLCRCLHIHGSYRTTPRTLVSYQYFVNIE